MSDDNSGAPATARDDQRRLVVSVVIGVLGWAWLWLEDSSAAAAYWPPTAAVLFALFYGAAPARALLPRALGPAWPWLSRHGTNLLVAGVALYLLRELFVAGAPISQDHAQHYLSTTALVEDLLGRGQWFGWSDRILGGAPIGETYGVSSYLFTAALHLLSFGAVPMRVSYAFGIVFVWLFATFAVKAWAHRLTGHNFAAVAALFALVDGGGEREGGWHYSMFHGVWPHYLTGAATLVGILLLVRLAEQPTRRRLAAAVAFVGLGYWLHPFASAAMVLFAPVVVLVLSFQRRAEEPHASAPRYRVEWVIVGYALAAVIGMAFVARYLANTGGSDGIKAGNAPFIDSQLFVLRMLTRAPFEGQATLVGMLALVGFAALLYRLRPFDVLTVSLFVSLFVIATMDLLVLSELGMEAGSVRMMYRRMVINLKPFWFAAAALGLEVTIRAIRASRFGTGGGGPRALVPLLAAAALSAPLVYNALAVAPRIVTRASVGDVFTGDDASLREVQDELRSLLAEESERLGPDRPWRIGHANKGSPAHYSLFAIADAGFGYLSNARVPALSWGSPNHGENLEQWRFLGASLVITPVPRKLDGLEEIRTIGPYHVFRLQTDPTWPVEASDGASVEVLEWAPDVKRFTVKTDGKPGTLVVGMAPHDKWHATQDGRALPLAEVRRGPNYHYIQIRDVRDGEVELRFENRARDNISLALALVVLLCCLWLAASERPLPELPPRLAAYLRLVVAAGTMGIVVAGTGMALRSGGEASTSYWLRGAPSGTEVLERLHKRLPDEVRPDPDRGCLRAFNRRPDVRCSPAIVTPRLVRVRRDLDTSRIMPCLSVGVHKGGATTVTYELPEGTTRVRGRVSARVKGRRLRGQLLVDGQVVEDRLRIDRVFTHDLDAPAGTVSVRIEAPKRRQAGCVELVALSTPADSPSPAEGTPAPPRAPAIDAGEVE